MRSLIRVLVMLVSCTLACGCSDHVTKIDECIKSAISTEKSWEYPFWRWGTSNIFHKSTMAGSGFENAVRSYLANTMVPHGGAFPLFVKFERIDMSPIMTNDGRLTDLHGDDERRYRIDAVVFGQRSQLLANRFYFLCPQGKVSVLWPRRFDNILAGMGRELYPKCSCQYREDVGTYRISWADIAPIFLGEEGHTLEKFLKTAVRCEGILLWGCGKFGLHEGKHVYETEKIVDWLGNWEFIIPLEVIFAARDTYVFSIGDWNTVHALKKKWLNTELDCSDEMIK